MYNFFNWDLKNYSQKILEIKSIPLLYNREKSFTQIYSNKNNSSSDDDMMMRINFII